MITATVFLIILFLTIILFVMYIVGFFNARIAYHANLIFSAMSEIKFNKRNMRQLPKKAVKLFRFLMYRRKLFVRKLKTKRLLRKAAKTKPALD